MLLAFRVYSKKLGNFRPLKDIELTRVPAVGEIVDAHGSQFLVLQSRHFEGSARVGEILTVATNSSEQLQVALKAARDFVKALEENEENEYDDGAGEEDKED